MTRRWTTRSGTGRCGCARRSATPRRAPPLAGAARADVAIWAAASSACGRRSASRSATRPATSSCSSATCAAAAPPAATAAWCCRWWPKLPSLVKPLRRRGGDPHRPGVRRRDRRDRGVLRRATASTPSFSRGGYLWTATTRPQLGAWDGVAARCDDARASTPFQRLEPAEVARRAGSPTPPRRRARAARRHRPARALARGLRRVALELGVRIHEHTPARRLRPRERPLRSSTAPGALTADQLVVATNAWAASLRELHRALVVDLERHHRHRAGPRAARGDRLDGRRGDLRLALMVAYYRTHRATAGSVRQGRLGHRVRRPRRRPPSTATRAGRDDARRTSGASTRRSPTCRSSTTGAGRSTARRRACRSSAIWAGREHLVYGVGWSGNGVGAVPCSAAGSSPASRSASTTSGRRCGLVDGRARARSRPSRCATPAPTSCAPRWSRKERAEAANRPPRRLAVRVAALAPTGLEDKG